MTDLPRLTIVVATTGDRINGIILPDEAPGIDYIICVQQDKGHRLDTTNRADVKVLPQEGANVSQNRNAGFKAAKGTLVLFNDDDVVLNPDAIDSLRACFTQNEALVLGLGWRAGGLPQSGKRSGTYRLTRFNTGHATVPGIMVRREPIQKSGIAFDPDFGVGARFLLGEEYIYVTDILRAGLNGVGFPLELGAHPHPSTGDNWHSTKLMSARRAMLARVFGKAHPFARAVFALKYRRRFATRKAMLGFALGF